MTVRILAATAIALFLVGLALGHVTAHASWSVPVSGFAPVVVPGIREGLGAGDTTLTTVEPSAPGSSNSPSLILEPDLATPLPRSAVEQPAPQPVTRPVVVAPKAGSAKDYARTRIGAAQFACLDVLWQRESGWNPLAHNPTSGAHGIPQALPGSKMGPGWWSDPIVQVRWGLGYIAGRYGTACNALAAHSRQGWY